MGQAPKYSWFEQIVEAHRYVDTGRKKGNVVITVLPEGQSRRSAASHRPRHLDHPPKLRRLLLETQRRPRIPARKPALPTDPQALQADERILWTGKPVARAAWADMMPATIFARWGAREPLPQPLSPVEPGFPG